MFPGDLMGHGKMSSHPASVEGWQIVPFVVIVTVSVTLRWLF